MDESTSESPSSLPASSYGNVPFVMKILASVLGAAVLWSAVWLLLENASLRHNPAWEMTVPTLFVAMISLVIYREHRKWWQPSRELKAMLDGCRAGERPINELKDVGRGMADLATAIGLLMHELRHQRQLTAELEAELRQRVASRTSALERKMNSLRAQTTRDPLTGLHNRRMLEECLPKMIQACRAEGGELSILAIDVDHFKTLNDTQGHAAGDEFLRSISQILRSGIREGDAAVRSGGDEFIILLPNCPLPAARSLGNRLTAMVQALGKTIKSPVEPGLSVGAASLRGVAAGASIEAEAAALLQMADKQLYLTKASRKRRAA